MGPKILENIYKHMIQSKTKAKFTNHLMLSGKKQNSENILLKSFKKFQQSSKKQTKKIFQLALLYSIPIFKLHETINKKLKKRKKSKVRTIPAFMSKPITRISLGIKYILLNISKKKIRNVFFDKLNHEILLIVKTKGNNLENKKETQKKTLLNKHYFRYYRW
jgi:ribosomal protein S7